MIGLGGHRTQPGVALYSRRVLVDPAPAGLLPEWLRFVRGAAESDDVPLTVARGGVADARIVGSVTCSVFFKFYGSRDR
jgi:TNF receptor-associated protein 1